MNFSIKGGGWNRKPLIDFFIINSILYLFAKCIFFYIFSFILDFSQGPKKVCRGGNTDLRLFYPFKIS